MKLSEYLKEYRAAEKISQRELGRRCDLSNSLISILEKGINPQTGNVMAPDLETYKKIADGTGTTLQDLFSMIDEDSMVMINDPDEDQVLLAAYHKADEGTKAAVRKLLDIKEGK